MTEENRNKYPGGEVGVLPSPLPLTGVGGDNGDELVTIDNKALTLLQEILLELKILNLHQQHASDEVFTEEDI